MLTRDEAEKVIGWLEEYPAGVPVSNWGTGTFSSSRGS